MLHDVPLPTIGGAFSWDECALALINRIVNRIDLGGGVRVQ